MTLSNEFRNKHKRILAQPRGAGYWIWKHEIIKNIINTVGKDDIVVYSDAGSSFNYYAKDRFHEYIDSLNSTEYGNFLIECESKHKEVQWTSSKLFQNI